MLRFLVRLLGVILLLAVIRAAVQWLYNQFTRTSEPSDPAAPSRVPHAQPGAAMIDTRRDPVCGAFVSPSHSLKATVQGQDVYFCSSACREKYLAA